MVLLIILDQFMKKYRYNTIFCILRIILEIAGTYRRLPALTGDCQNLPETASSYRRLPALTGNCRHLNGTTGIYRRLPALTGDCWHVFYHMCHYLSDYSGTNRPETTSNCGSMPEFVRVCLSKVGLTDPVREWMLMPENAERIVRSRAIKRWTPERIPQSHICLFSR